MKRESKEGRLWRISPLRKMRSIGIPSRLRYFHAKADEIPASLEFPSPSPPRENARDADLSSFLPSFFSSSPLPPSFLSFLSFSVRGFKESRTLAIQVRGTLVVRWEKSRHFCATYDSILREDSKRTTGVKGRRFTAIETDFPPNIASISFSMEIGVEGRQTRVG